MESLRGVQVCTESSFDASLKSVGATVEELGNQVHSLSTIGN